MYSPAATPGFDSNRGFFSARSGDCLGWTCLLSRRNCLNADLVILSACDTARGKISGGEGVIGMSWAAFIAGAPSIVASQWKVESSSTTELMLEFHRQLLSKKHPSKTEALRQASLKLMKSKGYSHPSYWAGFIVVGDGN